MYRIIIIVNLQCYVFTVKHSSSPSLMNAVFPDHTGCLKCNQTSLASYLQAVLALAIIDSIFKKFFPLHAVSVLCSRIDEL